MLNKNLPIDKLFLFAIIQLIAYGSLMMYSASSHLAEQNFGNHLYYLLKHIKWIAIGILLYQLVSRLRYRQIKTIKYLTSLVIQKSVIKCMKEFPSDKITWLIFLIVIFILMGSFFFGMVY